MVFLTKENREAHYGIFVTKDIESLPESIGWFNECNGNKLACALGNKGSDDISREEILCIVYKWAKLKILSELRKEKSVDIEIIAQKVESIKSKLEGLKAVVTECGNIKRSIEKITTLASNTQDDVSKELDSIIKTTSNWQESAKE